MDLKKQFSTNSVKETEGVWVPLDDTTKILVARSGNPAYRAYFQQLLKPHQATYRSLKQLPEAVAAEIVVKVMARTILKGWEKLLIAGAAIEYSEAAAAQVLKDYPDFRTFVQQCSEDIGLFQDQEEAADLGN